MHEPTPLSGSGVRVEEPSNHAVGALLRPPATIRELLRLDYEPGRKHRKIATSLGSANSGSTTPCRPQMWGPRHKVSSKRPCNASAAQSARGRRSEPC